MNFCDCLEVTLDAECMSNFMLRFFEQQFDAHFVLSVIAATRRDLGIEVTVAIEQCGVSPEELNRLLTWVEIWDAKLAAVNGPNRDTIDSVWSICR